MVQGRRRPKNYVFPEEDRSWPAVVILMILLQMLLLICCCILSFTARSDPKLDDKNVLVICGAAVVAFMLTTLLFVLKDEKARTAGYGFIDGSVFVRFGRTVRSLQASDEVHIAVKTIALGYRIAPVEKKYYMLWKEGAAIPEDLRHPFRALQKNDILLLPFNEKVRRDLAACFGKSAGLLQDAGKECDMDYVFSGDERGKHFFAGSVLQMLPAFLLGILINVQGKTGIALIVFFCGLGYIAILTARLFYPTAHQNIPTSFTWFRFSEDAVSMWLGEEKRTIHAYDPFRISCRTFLFSAGKGAVSEKRYLVLWNSSEPQPADNVGAFDLMERPNVIILPDTADVRNQLRERLGVQKIIDWAAATKENDKPMSIP